MFRKVAAVALSFGLVVACASGSEATKSSTTPANGGAGVETHSPEWYKIGVARDDFKTSEHDVEAAASDCQVACKALASLERAANHLCAVAEPEECSDARVRVDRARRAITAQCGGC